MTSIINFATLSTNRVKRGECAADYTGSGLCAAHHACTAADICQQEQIPDQFVYKIAKKLEKAGFIKIVRGAEGGCRLAVDLRTVSVYDLMEALDTDRLVNACMQPGYRCNWQEAHIESCGFHRRFEEIQERMDALLRSYSIDWLLYGRCL